MSPATMRVTLRLRTALGLPHSETLFADHAGPGRFRLLSNSYFAPMAVGDIVRVVEGREGLIIAGLAEAGPMAVSVIVIDRQVSLDDVKSIADSWRSWSLVE